MAIHYPPQYRYSLFEQWDKEAFALIKEIAKTKNYPQITGTKKEKDKFLIMLIRTQKSLLGWRQFLIDVLDQVKKTNIINTRKLLDKYPSESVGKDKPAWVTYEEDEIVNNFIDNLTDKKVEFEGTDKEIAEFILRFILGQLGHDWEQTIMVIWEMLGDEGKLSAKKLNAELKNFDYLGLFGR
jgi:hypothetical protein